MVWESVRETASGQGSQTVTEQTWTLGGLLDWTAKHLAQKGVESPRLDAEVLLSHAVGCKRIDLYGTRFSDVASPEVRQQYRELIRKRLEGCPVAYLVGRKEFFGLEFKVTPDIGVSDGIDAVRLFLPRCWFDAERCAAGIEALTQYRKKWNERLQHFEGTPEHDFASHGSDALRYLAVRHKPPQPKKKRYDLTGGPCGRLGYGLGWMRFFAFATTASLV